MRVALYQCPPLPLDVAGNLQRLHQLALEAKGADLLVVPEMFLTGYNIGVDAVSVLAEVHNGESAQQIARIAKTAGIAILYGYPERTEDGQIYNAVQLIDAHGERLCNYRKTHLFGDLDHSMFSAGQDDFPLVELNGWKLGFLICYDMEFPENARRLALAGAELILVPTANMIPSTSSPTSPSAPALSRISATWPTPITAAMKARSTTAARAASPHRMAVASLRPAWMKR